MEIQNLPIPDLEKQNIKVLVDLLQNEAEHLRHKIQTEVVGGVITKEWPRKDIDLTFKILDIKGKLQGTAMERTKKSFSEMEKIVHGAVRDGTYKIIKTTNPYLDHEFENPEIVAHDGSIVVMPLDGTLIEIINLP
jgi:hypothetical protein